MTNQEQAQALAKLSATENPLRIWNTVCKTDPGHTKEFTRGGGFRGTAINATYQISRATALFGPCGQGWGIDIESSQVIPGAPFVIDGHVVHESVYVCVVALWYRDPFTGKEGRVRQSGATTLVGRNKNGPFTDEEAVKKAITDATSKCLSWLGFSADIHMGLYDDNKYVAELRAEKAAEKRAKTVVAAPAPATPETVEPGPYATWAEMVTKDFTENVTSVEAYRTRVAVIKPEMAHVKGSDPVAYERVLATIKAKADALGITRSAA